MKPDPNTATGLGPNSLLMTDLYQLNMMQAYLDAGMEETAAFEFFVRKLPSNRGFLLAAGLEQAIAFLRDARFHEPDLEWLRSSGQFGSDFLDYLAGVRFDGDLDAMAEGTAFFPDEPILRVSAPLPCAQLVETRLINILQYQTLVASKAARMVLAAPDQSLVDFGLRRAHSCEAGVLAARASYLAGFVGTATVPAGAAFGIPIYGTMAHSFIQAHDREVDAFLGFARSRPKATIFLLDTYDTEEAAAKVVELAPQLRREGIEVRGIRLDSGDLGAHAFAVRRILDEGGLSYLQIIASGGIDEAELARLRATGAPIDAFGIGTSLVTSEDAPALDCAYKLQEYGGQPKRKRSEGKATWPGRKQVFRLHGANGEILKDRLSLAEETFDGEPLLRPVMRQGKLVAALPGMNENRACAAENLKRLPAHLRALQARPSIPVEVSPELRSLARELDGAVS